MLKLMLLWSVYLRDTAVVRLAKQLKQSGDFKTGDANMTVPGNSQKKSRRLRYPTPCLRVEGWGPASSERAGPGCW